MHLGDNILYPFDHPKLITLPLLCLPKECYLYKIRKEILKTLLIAVDDLIEEDKDVNCGSVVEMYKLKTKKGLQKKQGLCKNI